MPGSSTTLAVTQPIKVWNKPLNANFRDFFKGLAKAAIHGGIGEWASAGCDIADAFASIGMETSPGELAWLLIRSALTQATCDIVDECAGLIRPKDEADLDVPLELFVSTLENGKLTIDSTFFRAPKQISILADYLRTMKRWLELSGMNESQAVSACQRLGAYFVYALHDEWQKHSHIYEPLRAALDTPLTSAVEQEEGWRHYLAYLERQVDESMMGEPFSLRQVYIPLRAYYVKPPSQQKARQHLEESDRPRVEERIAVDLHEEISRWLANPNKDDAIRVISGGPGSGKSSFAKMLAARMASEGKQKVIYIPLHLFNPMADLSEAVGAYLMQSGLLKHNPLAVENGESTLLIIFDGLDELVMRGRAAEQVASEYLQHLNTFVAVRNTHQPRVQVVLAGRTLAVQSNHAFFRRPGQVVHVLPYKVDLRHVVRENQEPSFKYVQGNELLESDQRQEWWQKYGQVSGLNYKEFPLDGEALLDLTAQPLLNYLVALSYARGKVDFEKEVSLNLVYEDILHAVHERIWDPGSNVAEQGMEYRDFVRGLEEVAIATWHGHGRTTTVAEIMAHCTSAGLQRLFDVFQEKAEAGVMRLLTAFYFRQHSEMRDGENTFEFTHKSFSEYLIALRIVEGIRKIDRETQRHQTDPYDGWDMRKALGYWIEMTGPMAMDRYIHSFVQREIAAASAEADQWQQLLSQLINHMLRHGFPFEERKPQLIEANHVRNAGETLLAVLCASSARAGTVSTIDWPEPTSAGAWIRQLQGQRSGAGNVLALDCLARLSLADQRLDIIDLFNADLMGADLEETELNLGALQLANLEGANLKGANLQLANLEGANLQLANLGDANLQRANLGDAKLQRASLGDANLEGANLEDANLQRANLEGANLEGANLGDAKLLLAKLQRANLGDANLQRANLQLANLEGANLEGANLQLANLERANLGDANLEGANLGDVKLRGATVTSEQLQATRGRPTYLTDGTGPGADYQNLDTVDSDT